MIFDLAFTADTGQKERVFYETVVQVFDEDDCDDNFNLSLDHLARQDSRLKSLVRFFVSNVRISVAG
jgi:hypothetical protein